MQWNHEFLACPHIRRFSENNIHNYILRKKKSRGRFWCTIYFYDNLNMLILYLRVLYTYTLCIKKSFYSRALVCRWGGGERNLFSASLDAILNNAVKLHPLQTFNNCLVVCDSSKNVYFLLQTSVLKLILTYLWEHLIKVYVQPVHPWIPGWDKRLRTGWEHI